MVRPRLVYLLVFALTALMLACSSGDAEEDNGNKLTIRKLDGKEVKLDVEIAATPDERSRGLSNRDSLAENAGMFFVLEGRAGFWMKDTRIPLSIAFVAPCGMIVFIDDMEPLTLNVHNTREVYNFALEVNKGWFDAKGIKVGDTIAIPQQYRPSDCPQA
jgi:uncharacterized membrane protein (UPF0127 family)